MIQDWCIQHNMIPDTQYGFYPCRSTLQPLFILRHIKHAAQRMQSGSSRLYAAFIDFKQAYDCIPGHKLWGHLRSCQMPDHILSILKDLYHDDEYTLLDGDKTASVQPSFNALTQSNSSTARKILHADMQLSSQCDDCWSSHILSAMNGLTLSYLFKERLLKCEPIDLPRDVSCSLARFGFRSHTLRIEK